MGRRAFVGSCLLALAAAPGPAPAQDSTRAVAPGVRLERKLAAGQTHAYAFDLDAGQRLYVTLAHLGVDCALKLRGPDGAFEIDDQHRRAGVELISRTAAPGPYTLEVRAVGDAGPSAYYDLLIDALDPRSEEGRAGIAAIEAFQAGEQRRFEATPESRAAAVGLYERAIETWARPQDELRSTLALLRLGTVAGQLGRWQQARPPLERALEGFRRLGDRHGEALALARLGGAAYSLGERERAVELDAAALAPLEEFGDYLRLAWTLSDMGGALADVGRYEEALLRLEQSARLFRAEGDKIGELSAMSNSGVSYERLGRHQDALDAYEPALRLAREAGDTFGEAILLNNIGEIHRLLGDAETALRSYEEAHEKYGQIGDPAAAGLDAVTLSNIGRALENLGDLDGALARQREAIALSQAAGDRAAEGIAQQKVGWVQEKRGDAPAALVAHRRALELFVSVDDHQRAADAVRSIGDAQLAAGDPGAALESYADALPRQRAIGDRKAEAATLYGMARARLARGELERARDEIEAALAIVESLRADVVSQDLRAAYLGSTRGYYDVQVEVLLRLEALRPGSRSSEAALGVSERARARALLETLAEARAEIREGVEPELLERERSARRKLNLEAERLARTPAEDAGRSAAQRALELALAEYQAAQQQIRQGSPRYAALTQPQPLGLDEIRRDVLDDDTLLLEYWLGDTGGVVWAVTRTSFASFALPARTEVEAAARRYLEALQAQQLQTPGGGPPARYRRAAAALGQLVLEPVSGLLRGRRIVVVPDGILHYVPFAALPAPGEREFVPLVARHEVTHLPSASVLAVLRREAAARPRAERALAILADPVFQADDPRVATSGAAARAASSATAPGGSSPLLRAARQSGLTAFDRLPATRHEAELITRLVPSSERLEALDFAASRRTATAGDLSRYRILHFATHGLLNSQHPELSGLVLSLVDEQGRTQDGFLRLHDVYNLRLGADLVVLSACQTALGKQIAGEGLVGLTRGFMYAGAPRVLASLWKVDDRATAELMRRLYRSMLERGLAPSAALREAQLSLWRDPAWSAPRNWAAFTLQGDWR